MRRVKPTKFKELATATGHLETYRVGQIFHSQDFPNKLFLIKTGYVKRYQARDPEHKVLELIYGPEHIVSLSRLYKKLFNVDQNQDNFIYVYQAMTDVEMFTVSEEAVLQALDDDPEMYKDFFYESGLKLKSNITRLASNSIKDDYQKVAHQIVSLAYEFAGLNPGDTRKSIVLPLPQSATDMAEQLNISTNLAEAALSSLNQKNIIKVEDDKITILDLDLLKDVYL